jgi:hypothetical protein
MMALANVFIIVLLAVAAWLGTAAVVQKRTVRRRRARRRITKPAS